MICMFCGLTGIRTTAILKDHGCHIREDWARVAELKRQGKGESAGRLARKLLGVKGEPMNEETKEKLRRWKEDHAEEIKVRSDLERQTWERFQAITSPAKGPLRRKK